MARQIGIFDEIREEAHGRELSMRWYRQKVQELLQKIKDKKIFYSLLIPRAFSY